MNAIGLQGKSSKRFNGATRALVIEAPEQEVMSAYVYVDGLTSSVSMEVLIRLFSGCGTVRSIQFFPK